MKNISKDKKDFKLGGLYGSSSTYIVDKLTRDFDNVIILLSNNDEAVNFKEELSLFVQDQNEILLYLDNECFPYENLIVDSEVNSERIKTYRKLFESKNNIIISTYSAITKRITPIDYIKDNYRVINSNSHYNDIIDILKIMKYERTDRILNKGEYAIKGSIIDIFSVIEDQPIRLSFDGDKSDFIKVFDIETQKTIREVNEFAISSVNEIVLDKHAISVYKKSCNKVFDEEYISDIEYEKISQGLITTSMHNIIPLFYEKLSHFFDLLPKSTNLVISVKNIEDEIDLINERYAEYYSKYKEEKYLLEPKELIISTDEYLEYKKSFKNIKFSFYKIEEDDSSLNLAISKLPSLIVNNTYKDPYKSLIDYINTTSTKIVFCIDRNSLRIELVQMLDRIKINHMVIENLSDVRKVKSKVIICKKPLDEGFIDFSEKISFISAKDVYGKRSIKSLTKKRNKLTDNYINDISSIEIDSPVVHDEYGVGRYKGLINMDIEGIQTELIKLEYANEDILYIPVTSINLIKKYSGHTGLNIPLHNLGNDYWTKIKNKARKKVNDIAVELLEIESKRLAAQGFIFINKDDEYNKFKDDFPYLETTDQNNAINDVLNDMQSNKLMDRLVCGDVGFGKTEVIMRAAFLAAINNSQTMILAPTTILVEQHFKSFIKRFSHTAINIGKLSRLQTTKEKNSTKKDIASGNIDIIIGTHSLLSKDIVFKDLKLLIIDEEHKFGVTAKEKIKKIKSNIDVLTLTATPIPRTLNSALSQIKDLSIIETPPQNRKSIVTRIIDWDKEIISEAIMREINRGGQIYYVHNKIDTMDIEAKKILSINPNINIGIIHGQLEPKIIEDEMNKFLNKEYDLIICTSIIESGLDIQNVNTIIINNCNNFGLSQLHQIRGRVGRTNRQAYAYLIKSEKSIITKDAEKRLQAIDSVNSLGGGLELATHDLEIRGAGEILGEEQSGQIYEIGYAMFTDMLNKSVEILKTGSNPDSEKIVEIEADVSYLITQDYISDIVTRLKYYKRISSSSTTEENLLIKDEMIDIYGPIPEFVENLFYISDLKLSVEGKNIKYIKIVGQIIKISFIDQNLINVDKIIRVTKDLELKLLKDKMIQLKIVKENFKDICTDISNLINTIC